MCDVSNPFFQPLESRQLWSAGPSPAEWPAMQMDSELWPAFVRPLTVFAPGLPIARGGGPGDTLPSLLGRWKGNVTVTIGPVSRTVPFELRVTAQTPTRITATVTVGGAKFRGKLALRWRGGTRFTASYSGAAAGASGTITATVDAARGRLTGTFSGTGLGLTGTGKLSARRIA